MRTSSTLLRDQLPPLSLAAYSCRHLSQPLLEPSQGKSHQAAKLQTSLSPRQVERIKVHQNLTGPVEALLSKTCLCHGQQPQGSNMAINNTSPARAIRRSLGHDGLATAPELPSEPCLPHPLIWMKQVTAVSPVCRNTGLKGS